MAKQYRVAAQLFGFRDFMKTPEDLAKTFAKVKKMGYDYGQISGCPLAADVVRKAADNAGLGIIGAHIGLNLFREDEKKVIADCKTYGTKYVAIPWLNRADYKTQADWKKLFKEFDGYAQRFAKQGIIVQYHNHAFEFEKFGIKKGSGGTTILDILYSGTKHIQAELDFGWVARGGYNPVLWAQKMKGRLDQVHLKDWGIIDDKPEFRAIGEGSLDWAAIIKAAKASGSTDFIVEQDSCPATNDPFLSYSISRKNLKEKFGL